MSICKRTAISTGSNLFFLNLNIENQKIEDGAPSQRKWNQKGVKWNVERSRGDNAEGGGANARAAVNGRLARPEATQ